MKLKLSPHATWEAIRRNLIWFLLLAYGMAAFLPAPGNSLRNWQAGELPFSGDPLNFTHLLLGILLFCVGASIRLGAAGSLAAARKSVLAGLVGSWLVPMSGLALLAVSCAPFLSDSVWGAFLIGAAVVVAMPPANSASVWSEMSAGPTACTVAVIVLGTLLCPLMTPVILGLVASASAPVGLTAAEMSGSLEVLTAFVVLPASAGVAMRLLFESMRPDRVHTALATVRATSLITLLVLNYANAAVALPRLLTHQFVADTLAAAILSFLLCAAVFLVGHGASRMAAAPTSGARLSFVYVVGMKNTGAALVLATSALALHPQAVLIPVFYTIAQHLAAALTDRYCAQRTRVDVVEPRLEKHAVRGEGSVNPGDSTVPSLYAGAHPRG